MLNNYLEPKIVVDEQCFDFIEKVAIKIQEETLTSDETYKSLMEKRKKLIKRNIDGSCFINYLNLPEIENFDAEFGTDFKKSIKIYKDTFEKNLSAILWIKEYYNDIVQNELANTLSLEEINTFLIS